MSVYALDFGTTSTGMPTHLYRLKNSAGMEVDITDVGASIVAVRVPTEDGTLVDVTLGYDESLRYERNEWAFGATVGRCANRIADASFELDGHTYTLTANEGRNALHGGRDMWYFRLWDGATIGKKGNRRRGASADTAIFGLLSPDGDQGFPGELDVRVTYTLTEDNELRIVYDAQPGLKTIVNLTNHAYWNLNGHDSGTILDHTLQILAEKYTPTNHEKIPDGRMVNVGGTPFDFRTPKLICQDFSDRFGNYDHNYVLSGNGRMQLAATLVGNKTGIAMDVLTDMPAMQVFTARSMNCANVKGGGDYTGYAGIALETQFCPDAIHHPAFQQPVFSPENPFHHCTTYRFRTA